MGVHIEIKAEQGLRPREVIIIHQNAMDKIRYTRKWKAKAWQPGLEFDSSKSQLDERWYLEIHPLAERFKNLPKGTNVTSLSFLHITRKHKTERIPNYLWQGGRAE
jgi:hypothetical protein